MTMRPTTRMSSWSERDSVPAKSAPLVSVLRKFLRSFGEALARAIAPKARELLGGRICVVTGPSVLAGAMALQLPERPSVLIDGRYDRSPWVDKRVVQTCGAVELSDGMPLPGDRAVGPAFPGLTWRIQFPSAIGRRMPSR